MIINFFHNAKESFFCMIDKFIFLFNWLPFSYRLRKVIWHYFVFTCVALLFGGLGWTYYATIWGRLIISIVVFSFICMLILLISSCHFFHRHIFRNSFFLAIFVLGCVAYEQLSKEQSKSSVDTIKMEYELNRGEEQQQDECYFSRNKEDLSSVLVVDEKNIDENATHNDKISCSENEGRWYNFLKSILVGNTTAAAFFPSRGGYDVDCNGISLSSSSEAKKLSNNTLFWYALFHVGVYVFFGYFALTLWGGRLRNRLNFWVSLDKNRNIFWCDLLEKKMLILAKDIYEKDHDSQIVFSMSEHSAGEKTAEYFQNMNFHGYSLKIRKEDQIHYGCLRAAKQFFISDDADWNIRMAKHFLEIRERANIDSLVKLYIKIDNDARKIYFENWADSIIKNNEKDGKEKNEIEVYFLDDCLLTARKFVQDYPMLDSIPADKKDTKNACVNAPVNVLIIGFGGYGRALLEQMICDAQYIDSEGNRQQFSVDIIEGNRQKWEYYKIYYKEVCERFNFKFHEEIEDIRSNVFYEFLQENLNPDTYNRIVVALGNDNLNLECAAIMESVIRKKVDLLQEDPLSILQTFKKKIHVVLENSPIFSNNKKNEDCIDGLFTVIGQYEEIFTKDIITDEVMDKRGQWVNWLYEAMYKSDFDINKIPSSQNVTVSWNNVSMFNRASSRASAAGLRNIMLLVGGTFNHNWFEFLSRDENKKLLDNLAKIEHLRWMAFELLSGYSLWSNPQKNEQLKSANQTKNFYRHAALVETKDLHLIDNIFCAKDETGKIIEPTNEDKDKFIVKSAQLVYEQAG